MPKSVRSVPVQRTRARSSVAATLAGVVAAHGLVGCSPALNWRDVRPAGGAVTLQFPCRPDTVEREVVLAGTAVKLQLLRCQAAGLTWAFTQADVGSAAQVPAALQALRDTAMANVGATTAAPLAKYPGGLGPGGATTGLAFTGHLPGGEAAQVRLVVFSSGTHVHQATVFGPTVPADSAAAFFDSLRVRP